MHTQTHKHTCTCTYARTPTSASIAVCTPLMHAVRSKMRLMLSRTSLTRVWARSKRRTLTSRKRERVSEILLGCKSNRKIPPVQIKSIRRCRGPVCCMVTKVLCNIFVELKAILWGRKALRLKREHEREPLQTCTSKWMQFIFDCVLFITIRLIVSDFFSTNYCHVLTSAYFLQALQHQLSLSWYNRQISMNIAAHFCCTDTNWLIPLITSAGRCSTSLPHVQSTNTWMQKHRLHCMRA